MIPNYEDGEAPAEFVSTVEEHYRETFYQTINMVTNCIRDRFQQKDYVEAFQTMENLLLKALREEDFGLELQQISSFFGSDLDKFKLETQLTTLTHIIDEKASCNKRCNKNYFIIKYISKDVSI